MLYVCNFASLVKLGNVFFDEKLRLMLLITNRSSPVSYSAVEYLNRQVFDDVLITLVI